MIRILIVDDNPNQCRQIINYISSSLNNSIACYMAFSGKETLNIIENEEIDIILLDWKLSDISSDKIISYIEEKKLYNYIDSIIIITGYNDEVRKFNSNPFVYSVINKPTNLEKLRKYINDIIEEKEDENMVKYNIKDELLKLHYNLSYNGTQYIYESIYELYLRRGKDCDNLKKFIYPIVAKRHHTNINNIHCNIKQATKCMYYDCPEEIIKKYFKFTEVEKPKEKLVINTVLNEVMKNLN